MAPGVERRIAQKLESVAMEPVASSLGDHGDDAAVIVSIFGVEVVGQHPELIDRIEVRNDGCAAVHVLLHIDPVHQEPVHGLVLAVDLEVAGIQVARRIEAPGDAGHDH